MISFGDIIKLFSFDIEGKMCIEVEFRVEGEMEYASCWMGKMPDDDNEGQDLYWYGLKPDGSAGLDYDSLEAFLAAPVFGGRTMEEIWGKIRILSIDGLDPEERIRVYI